MTSDWKLSDPLRLGFIGGGLNSAIGSAHFHSSMLDDQFRVVSGCFSRDESVNLATCKRWHIDPSRCSTDWREYLEQACNELDAICILTPIPAHHEMLIAAMEHGIPIICEKALVSHTRQATQLMIQQEENPSYLAVTFNYSGYPAVRLLRSLVAKGTLGTVQQVHLEMPLENYLRVPIDGTEPPKPQVWRQSDSVIPTLLLDLGVHLHHLLSFISGQEAKAVMASFNHFSDLPNIVDDARIWLDCTDGLQASMWMSKTALGYRNGMRIRIFGTNGSAEWLQSNPETIQHTSIHGIRSQFDRGVENEILSAASYNRFKAGHPAGYIEAFANLYSDIADSLREFKQTGQMLHPNVFGITHARNGLAMLESATESARSERWTPVKPDVYGFDELNEPSTGFVGRKVA